MTTATASTATAPTVTDLLAMSDADRVAAITRLAPGVALTLTGVIAERIDTASAPDISICTRNYLAERRLTVRALARLARDIGYLAPHH